jgi:hypothetical protein
MMFANDHEPVPPYKVSLVRVLVGHDDDGDFTVREGIQSFNESLGVAWQLTQASVEQAESFDSWQTDGDVGLVYDSLGMLVWDGLVEAVKRHAGEAGCN